MLDVEPHLAGDDAAHVEQVFDDAGLLWAIAALRSTATMRSSVLFAIGRLSQQDEAGRSRGWRSAAWRSSWETVDEKLVFDSVGPFSASLAGKAVH